MSTNSSMRLLLMFLLFLLLNAIFLAPGNLASVADDDVDEESDAWTLRMLKKVRWDISKSYMAEHKVEISGLQRALPYERQAYLLGADGDNIRVRFDREANTGVAYCQICTMADEDLTTLEQKQPDPEASALQRIAAAAGDCKWRMANGTFNKKMPEPQCLYDFFEEARDEFEYNLFRYCTKGYFFNGKDYTDEDRKRGREEWLLYLAVGHLQCKIGENVEANRALLARGYTVELVQYTPANPEIGCDAMTATLCSYNDKDRDGQFVLGAVVGAGQLERSQENKKFWDEVRKGAYRGQCATKYHHHIRNQANIKRLNLDLVVTHYCTERAMRETLRFNVSIGREMVPDGIYEDRGIIIVLNTGEMLRTTGDTLKKYIRKDA